MNLVLPSCTRDGTGISFLLDIVLIFTVYLPLLQVLLSGWLHHLHCQRVRRRGAVRFVMSVMNPRTCTAPVLQTHSCSYNTCFTNEVYSSLLLFFYPDTVLLPPGWPCVSRRGITRHPYWHRRRIVRDNPVAPPVTTAEVASVLSAATINRFQHAGTFTTTI